LPTKKLVPGFGVGASTFRCVALMAHGLFENLRQNLIQV